MPAKKDLSGAIDRIARKCHVERDLVEDAYPCTSLQTALMTATLNKLGNYVSRFVFDLPTSALDRETMKSACEKIYEQNAILRSRIIENGGKFLQIVLKERLSWLEGDDLQKYLAEDRRHSIALGEPLGRFAWLSEPSGKSYMIWSLHHCQYDEWSFQLLIQDLKTIVTGKYVPTPRTQFSKFIKALNHIDAVASRNFWRSKLLDLSNCHSIVPAADICRTSQRCIKSAAVQQVTMGSTYQPSLLAVAVWSLLVGHFSSSSHVIFGHVLSGRAFDMNGIQEVSGPTMATVPWYVKIPQEKSVREFLDQLQELRRDILPFEQTGLDEYRKLVGSGAFDTLLSIRSSHGSKEDDADLDGFLPREVDSTGMSHPCSMFLEIDVSGKELQLKGSYDERWIDAARFNRTMDIFISTMEKLSLNLETKVVKFQNSLQLPTSLENISRSYENEPRLSSSVEEESNTSKPDTEIMKKVFEITRNVVGSEKAHTIGPDTTLIQLGMDSLKTVVFSQQLAKVFNVTVPFAQITGPNRSLVSISTSITMVLKGNNEITANSNSVKLLEKAESYMKSVLSPDKLVYQKRDNSKPQTQEPAILLTGATGYLGIEILRQCLSVRSHKLILLVRCTSPSEGFDRVTHSATLAQWRHEEIEWLQQVQIWPSDLTKERLGLSSEHWQILSDPDFAATVSSISIKAIIHNGAKVDFLHSYTDLEAANVRSTAILLQCHLKSRAKPTFVLVTGGRPCPNAPDDIEETSQRLASAAGYAQTKFVSEVLLHKTRALYQDVGEPVQMSIVHPGAIIGRANNGVANTDDFLWNYVAASIDTGCYVPAVPTKREWVNVTPIDSVAATVVAQALDSLPLNSRAVNRCLIRLGLTVSKFWSLVLEVVNTNGIMLEPVSEWEWVEEFKDDLDRKGQGQPLFALSQLVLQGQLRGIGGLPPRADASTHDDANNATENAVRSNVRYLMSKGFFSSCKAPSEVFTRSKS